MRDTGIVMPQPVCEILDILEKNGCEAFIVGGCVRDSIMGRSPNDWDITTNAAPDRVKAIFAAENGFHTVDTGIQHGTVTVIKEHIGYEVTTYRIDGEYSDNRHPDSVLFTQNIEDDLARRDFTVNAIAYSPKRGFVDPFDGRGDIGRETIRGVGNAADRFDEDALRVMRAVRFAAQLGFKIEENTHKAVFEKAALVKNISIERIREEFTKTLLSDRPQLVDMYSQTGILDIFIPGIVYIPEKHGKRLLEASGKLSVRLALLLEASHFDDVNRLLKGLTYDNDTARTTAMILKCADMPAKTRCDIRLLINRAGEECAGLILYFGLAGGSLDKSTFDTALAMHGDIIKSGECCSVKQLAITGSDLMERGVPAGPRIGELLNAALAAVLRDPQLNNKERIIEFLKI